MVSIQHPGDLFSLLSDDLLIKILCSVESYNSAVRCSAVSRRWRHLYKRLPCLHLKDSDFGWENGKQKLRIVAMLEIALVEYHQGIINTLSLEGTQQWKYHFWKWCLDYFIRRNTLEHIHFVVCSCGSDMPREFPHSILSACSSLVTLTLTYTQHTCVHYRVPPRPFPQFPNLRHCNLSLELPTNVEAQMFGSWLPKCPHLQTLQLSFCLLYTLEELPMPLVFSSPSLLELHIHLQNMETPYLLEIRVHTPELLRMRFQCSDEVEMHVNAPKLLKISVPTDHVALSIAQFLPRLIKARLHAEWSDPEHHNITVLELACESEPQDSVAILNLVSDFKTLQFLLLSGISAQPEDFRRMLGNLHLLQELTLTDCYYIEGENNREFLDEREFHMPKLAEICLTNSECCCFPDERKMLDILLQIAPNLRMLIFVLKCQDLECRKKYTGMFRELSSSAEVEFVLTEFSAAVKFALLRNPQPQ